MMLTEQQREEVRQKMQKDMDIFWRKHFIAKLQDRNDETTDMTSYLAQRDILFQEVLMFLLERLGES